jgi:ketosteroid isomerase-like protein
MVKVIYRGGVLDGEETGMKTDPATVLAVKDVIAAYAKAFASRNLDGMMALFSSDPDVVHIGTGKDEWGNGPTAVKKLFMRDFSQSEGVYFTFGKMTIASAGAVAWVAAPYTASVVTGKMKLMMDGRLSLVLQQKSGKWLIRQLHISHPDAGQKAGQSFPSAS